METDPVSKMLGFLDMGGAHNSVVIKALCYKPKAVGLRPNEVTEFYQFT
jgi:hypothetical protein